MDFCHFPPKDSWLKQPVTHQGCVLFQLCLFLQPHVGHYPQLHTSTICSVFKILEYSVLSMRHTPGPSKHIAPLALLLPLPLNRLLRDFECLAEKAVPQGSYAWARTRSSALLYVSRWCPMSKSISLRLWLPLLLDHEPAQCLAYRESSKSKERGWYPLMFRGNFLSKSSAKSNLFF